MTYFHQLFRTIDGVLKKSDKLTLPRPRRGLSPVDGQTHEQEDEPSLGRDSLKKKHFGFL